MTGTSNIGTRIELVPMDGNFHDITVALYRQALATGPAFLVHSYSSLAGTGDRVAQIATTLTRLASLIPADEGRLLRFACGDEHNLAVRRAFLEACKIDPAGSQTEFPLQTLDRKSGLQMVVDSLGDGQYRVRAEGDDPEGVAPRRVGVIVNGLLKLGDMRRITDTDTEAESTGSDSTQDCVAFSCGCSHDALVGLLLLRAPNVRAIVREQESMAARGVLSAPSSRT